MAKAMLGGVEVEVDEDRILDRIHHTLNINHTKELMSIESIGNKKKKPLQLLRQYFSRAAAILFLPFFI